MKATLPRNILIAPDKFKGTLSAGEAGRAMALGVIEPLFPVSPRIDVRPLADGGEGSLELLGEYRAELEKKSFRGTDPDGGEFACEYLQKDEIFLETARAIGLGLPDMQDKPFLKRDTHRVGIFLARALAGELSDSPPRAVSLFLGGSATCDGGFGLARALGFRFLDSSGGRLVSLADLDRLDRIEPPPPPPPRGVAIRLYLDVQNPLLGPGGAPALFAPQKGATPGETEFLESALERLDAVFASFSGRRRADVPGAGAAGGLALPLLHWAHPELLSGADFFIEEAGLPELFRADRPDLVLTGEGCTDRGTLAGKIPYRLTELCRRENGPPCLVVSGGIRDREELKKAGLENLYAADGPGSDPGERLTNAVARSLASFLNREEP